MAGVPPRRAYVGAIRTCRGDATGMLLFRPRLNALQCDINSYKVFCQLACAVRMRTGMLDL